jgi:lysosomal acid lipase/cholesteryl ester hydrolase
MDSPTLMFLFFGRKSILSSVIFWQQILFPPIFTVVIDTSLSFLFDWTSINITATQKLAAYAHLYSLASVKAVVHWFQIMRNSAFVMYDDDIMSPMSTARTSTSYRPARFPTRNIMTPIVLLYGDADSLVDIRVMLKELPRHTIDRRLRGYEHLDVLWGKDVHVDVIPEVINALRKHCENPEMVIGKINYLGAKGIGGTLEDEMTDLEVSTD